MTVRRELPQTLPVQREVPRVTVRVTVRVSAWDDGASSWTR